MYTIERAFKSLFEINMGVKPGERILVFTDTVRNDEAPDPADFERRERLRRVAEEAAGFADRSYGFAEFISYPATSASGAEPPEELWRAAFGARTVEILQFEGLLAPLLTKEATPQQVIRAREIVQTGKNLAVDVVVAMANNSTSHTRFRSLLNLADARFASLPHFDPDMFFTSMRVDWERLADRTRRLALKINEAVEIRVVTENGTSMRFGKINRTASSDDGLLTLPGSFGNLPAGEVYLAPVEGESEGVMYIEYAPTRMLESPLCLVVKKGRVTEIIGDEPYRQVLEEKFARSDLNRNVAELGIGTNDRANRPDNILEAEKILGTIHIALGDNSSFGGTVSTSYHEDFVFYHPTLKAINQEGNEFLIMDNGRLVI